MLTLSSLSMAPRKKVTDPGLFEPDEPLSDPESEASVKVPRRRTTRAAPSPADERVAASLARLPELVERLEALIAEVPKAVEFEPLAEHIYSFAQTGP